MEKFIKQLVRGSGAILKKHFRTSGVSSQAKTHILDLVTKADLASEKYIIQQIKSRFPDHNIISEEKGDQKIESENTWIIDPLDGTLNFARGIPQFVSQVAFAHKGKLLYTALYDPILDELYFAQKDKGAFCNGKRINCSKNKNIEAALLGYTVTLNSARTKELERIATKVSGTLRIRAWGSIGLMGCYAATGRVDYALSRSGKIWDNAPVALLVKEAGGIVKNFRGRAWSFEDPDIVVGNAALVDEFIKTAKPKL